MKKLIAVCVLAMSFPFSVRTEVAAQSCTNPAPYQGAYLQFLIVPDLPYAAYNLMEIIANPVEWKTVAELDADGNPNTSGRFRMLALYFDLSNANGVITNYSSAGNLKIHNNAGDSAYVDVCTSSGLPQTRIYSFTLFNDNANLGKIAESTPSMPFMSKYDAGEGTNAKWNSFYLPTNGPMYPEGFPLTLRIEKIGKPKKGRVSHYDKNPRLHQGY